jgi:hypothetical protein
VTDGWRRLRVGAELLLLLAAVSQVGAWSGDTIPNRGDSGHVPQFDAFLLDTCPHYLAAEIDQQEPAVAAGTSGMLVVWEDTRDHVDIFGCRVGRDGVVCDTTGFAVSAAASTQRSPAVAFDGVNYLVVWHDYRSDTVPDIYGARVTEDGQVMDPNGIPVSLASGAQAYPALAFGGQYFLAVWQDYRNGDSADIYAARIDGFGNVLDPAGILISGAATSQWYPAVAFDGTNFLVTWQDKRQGNYYDLYGARVSPSGTVLDPEAIHISRAGNSQRRPVLAFAGENYLVAWQDRRNGPDNDIYCARVDRNGQVLDSAGLPVCVMANAQERPAIAFDGTNCLVIWQDMRRDDSADIYAARIDQSGNVLDPGGFAVSARGDSQQAPAVAFSGQEYLCIWQDHRSGTVNQSYATRVLPTGEVVGPMGIPLLLAANAQYRPAVAWSGSDFLAVWEDRRSGSDIYGIRLDAQGGVKDTVPFAIAVAPGGQSNPGVVFDGQNYAVVWQDERSGVPAAYAARVSRSGVLLDSAGIRVGRAGAEQTSPRIAADGQGSFAVWEDSRGGVSLAIYGTRLNWNGDILDSNGIAVAGQAFDHRAPDVTFNGRDYFVVWQDWRSGSNYSVYGARVTSIGQLLDSSGITIAGGGYFEERPAVTWGETDGLVVWEDQRGTQRSIYGTRLTRSGSVLDTGGIALGFGHGDLSAPCAVSSGAEYFVAWQAGDDILAIHLAGSGAVYDSFALTTQPGEQQSPELAANSAQEVLAVFSGWTDRAGTKMFNSQRAWAEFFPWAGIETRSVRPTSRRGSPVKLAVEPNPGTGRVRLRVEGVGEQPSGRRVRIADASGRRVRTLRLNPSLERSVFWDGCDGAGQPLPAGVYVCYLEEGGRTEAATLLRLVR